MVFGSMAILALAAAALAVVVNLVATKLGAPGWLALGLTLFVFGLVILAGPIRIG